MFPLSFKVIFAISICSKALWPYQPKDFKVKEEQTTKFSQKGEEKKAEIQYLINFFSPISSFWLPLSGDHLVLVPFFAVKQKRKVLCQILSNLFQIFMEYLEKKEFSVHKNFKYSIICYKKTTCTFQNSTLSLS